MHSFGQGVLVGGAVAWLLCLFLLAWRAWSAPVMDDTDEAGA